MNRYFYIDSEGKQKGTFSPEELKSENIKKDTFEFDEKYLDMFEKAKKCNYEDETIGII